MVFIAVPSEEVAFTRGAPTVVASSSFAKRGFCPECGTPLTYQYKPDRLSLTHGSLDEPGLIAPTERLSSETVLPWSEHVGMLPIESLAEWIAAKGLGVAVHQQLPDHD